MKRSSSVPNVRRVVYARDVRGVIFSGAFDHLIEQVGKNDGQTRTAFLIGCTALAQVSFDGFLRRQTDAIREGQNAENV